MGKSTIARAARRMKIPVHDSDRAVHRLLNEDGKISDSIKARFPEAIVENKIDKAALAKIVFADKAALTDLESLLHPEVLRMERSFLKRARREGRKIVLLDIPLLFETGANARCDATMVASAPAFIQEARAMRRPGMSKAKLHAILTRQMPDRQKRHRADFVIPTGLDKRVSFSAFQRVIRKIREKTL